MGGAGSFPTPHLLPLVDPHVSFFFYLAWPWFPLRGDRFFLFTEFASKFQSHKDDFSVGELRWCSSGFQSTNLGNSLMMILTELLTFDPVQSVRSGEEKACRWMRGEGEARRS